MSGEVRIQNAIQWYEGMLLEPHHFQQNDHRFQQLLSCYAQRSRSFYWGVLQVKIDTVALVAGLLRITDLTAIMPDGLLVTQDVTSPDVLEFDIKKNAIDLDGKTARVFVLVQAYRLGEANTTGDLARFTSVPGAPVVDENTGENPLSFPRICPKLMVFVGDDPPPHVVAMPIAEITFEQNSYTLTDYVPPCLGVPIHSPLGGFCEELIRQIRRKVAHLVQQTQNTSNQYINGELRDALRVCVATLPPLEALFYANCAHPFV